MAKFEWCDLYSRITSPPASSVQVHCIMEQYAGALHHCINDKLTTLFQQIGHGRALEDWCTVALKVL